MPCPSKESSIPGNCVEFSIVYAIPDGTSFLQTNTAGDAQGECEGSAMSFISIVCTSSSAAGFRWKGGP